MTAAWAWCGRWRMQANVGPGKSAVMLSAPVAAATPLVDGDLLWGAAPLPVVHVYKYLGVVLAANCGWDDHVTYVVDKATKRAFALGGVLHNRRMATAVRRVVLLAVLRPVVEHASTVWCTTAAQQQRLEQVQTRVLRRIMRLPCAVADDVLRMELGCRPYASWMDQRKLEFAFRLAAMEADRMPARVASACWPRLARRGLPSMHACVVSALEHAVGLKVADLAAAGGVTTAAFKKLAGEAVRVRDVRSMRRDAKSTVCHHLRVLGGPGRHANQLQRYLAGPLTEVQRFKFICRAGVLPTARRRFQQGRAQTAQCPLCPERPEETMQHALLACSAFAAERAAMWAALEQEVGLPAAGAAQALPADRQLAALLGDAYWGDRARAVGGVVQQYLGEQMRRRRSLLPAAVAAGGVADDPADVACQACNRRSGAPTMLLCDRCGRGYHMRCLVPALTGVPDGDWVCPGCADAPVPAPRLPAPPCRRRPRSSYDDVACQVCAGQHGAPSMLLCDGCDRGFHMRCIGMRQQRPPAGDWYCSDCPRPPSGTASTAVGRTGRGARAHGARA